MDGLHNWKANQVVQYLLWYLTSAYMKCVCGWAGGRTLRQNQIFSDGLFTKFCYPWCSAIRQKFMINAVERFTEIHGKQTHGITLRVI